MDVDESDHNASLVDSRWYQPNTDQPFTVNPNSLSFGLAWGLSMDFIDQASCKVKDTWMTACDTFLDQTCDKVDMLGGPYACITTVEEGRTFFEAIGTAYANLAFLSSLVLPAAAVLMVKMGKEGEEKKEGGEAEASGL